MPRPAARDDRPRVVVAVDIGRAYGRAVAGGVAEYLRGHAPWDVTLLDTARLRDGDPLPVGLAGAVRRADGFVCEGTPAARRRLARRRVPTIFLAEHPEAAPVVAPDDAAVARLAFDHLRGLNPATLAFAGFPGAAFSEVRRDAFAAAAGGLRFADVSGTDGLNDGPALGRRLRALPRPLAVFAVNTAAARRVAAACHGVGLAVPDDAAVLGVDDDEVLCELCDPPLSAVDHNTRGVGLAAAATLDALFRGEAVPPLRRVPPVGVTARRSTDVLGFDDADVRRAVRFVRDRATGDADLDVAAVVAHVAGGRRRLEQAFRREVGRGIHAEILRLRVAAARRLLAGTPLAMPDVAARSGFRSATDLAKVFRRLEGTTPTAFRRAASS